MSLLKAPTYRWTVEEYEELGRKGIFHEDDRVELFKGEIVIMSPIGFRHATAVMLLSEFFSENSRRRFFVNAQNPFNLDEHSQPQPDLTLLDRAFVKRRRHPEPQHIYLAIEVADSTLRYDREDKGPAYAERGIREFWLLNLEKDVLEVFRQPGAGGYAEQRVLGAEETIAPLAFPDLVLRVGDFLP